MYDWLCDCGYVCVRSYECECGSDALHGSRSIEPTHGFWTAISGLSKPPFSYPTKQLTCVLYLFSETLILLYSAMPTRSQNNHELDHWQNQSWKHTHKHTANWTVPQKFLCSIRHDLVCVCHFIWFDRCERDMFTHRIHTHIWNTNICHSFQFFNVHQCWFAAKKLNSMLTYLM